MKILPSNSNPSIATATPPLLSSTSNPVESSHPENSLVKTEPLAKEINLLVSRAVSLDQLLGLLAQLATQHSDCLGFWYLDSQAADSAPTALLDVNEDVIGQMETRAISQIAQQALGDQGLVYLPSTSLQSTQLVACPIEYGNNIQGALVGSFSTQNQAPLRHHWLITLICQAASNWIQARIVSQSNAKTNSLNDAMALVKSLDLTDSIGAAGRTLVNHMRRLTESDQVSFVYQDQENKTYQLIAVSGLEQIDETAEVNQSILAVCKRTIELQSPVVYPNDAPADEQTDKLLQQYSITSRYAACIGLPMVDNSGESIGALLISGDEQSLCQPKLLQYLQLVSQLIAGHFAIVLKANLGLVQRAKQSIRSTLSKHLRQKVLMVIGALILTMLIPLPYKVGCDCQLEPVVRRFVAAPYDGILEKTLAKSGEIVEVNQLLATLDGRTLRIELAGLEADFDAAKKRRDSALATGDVAQSHIARSEMKRHQSRIELVNRRLKNLEIRSPINGIIVSEDLEQVEGAPLETGQTLFEVGPLDQMVAEIQVPENEIRFIQPGQHVKIKLNAYPFQTFHGTVKHIHTRAEIVTDANVFVAEVVMENSDGRLKPGMAGSAKISSGVYPLGWNLFHNGWEKLRYWMIW